ncbi:hypothetical protein VNO77_06009 [Canavalia gladiata]|uniref:Uncharacterized protein n=1 Tax=Canavalia gladiata TaxID=3824 RepID=A0AAN9MZD5_CANGL
MSVSVFSFFVWYSSGFSILPQSFNAYFSTCLFSMLTHTLERKYMFLIFNLILALLAKTTILTSSSQTFDIDFQASTNTNANVSEEPVFPLASFLMIEEEEEGIEQVKKKEECYEQVSEAEGEEELFTESEGRVNEACIAEDDEREGRTEGGVMVTEDEELADAKSMATNEEVASTDELNRKIEEFIRKMKEEMRIEAQTQPIAV